MDNEMQLPPQFQASQLAIEKRRKMAEMLLQQGLKGQQGIQAGRFYVPPNPLSALLQGFQGYAGAKGMEDADTAQKGLANDYQSGLASEVQRIAAMRQGQPATTDAADNIEQQPVAPDRRGAIAQALTSQYAPVRRMGELQHKTFENEMTRENDRSARMHERILALEERSKDRAAAAEDRAAAAQQAQDLRRELSQAQRTFGAQQASENRSFQAEQRDLDRAARAELARERIEAKRTEKLEATKGKTDEGKSRVSVNLNALSDYYRELDKLGALVDTEKSGMANISARVRASGAGQLLGGALGTQEQSYRNQVNQMRPLLLQEIRQASAMGARGLDSNKELEFYLQAATDPARDRQANMAAIQVLENAYGLSSKIEGVDQSKLDALKKEFAGSGGGAAPAKSEWSIRPIP